LKELATTKKERNKMLAVMAKQRDLLKTTISVGSCTACPLKESCEHANETDETCRAVDIALTQFWAEVLKSPWIEETDSLGIRNLGALYGSIILAELYFKQYGSIEAKKGGLAFSHLHKDYQKMLTQLNDGLSSYGLTPIGRKKLKEKVGVQDTETTIFQQYIETSYADKKTEKKTNKESKGPKRKTKERTKEKVDATLLDLPTTYVAKESKSSDS